MSEYDLEALHKAYISLEDPTEYLFSQRLFPSYKAYEEFCLGEHKEIIECWRRELKAKIKSNALKHILEVSLGETRDSLQANKLLLDSPWEESPRGRPSKEDISKELKRNVENNSRLKEDIELLHAFYKDK